MVEAPALVREPDCALLLLPPVSEAEEEEPVALAWLPEALAPAAAVALNLSKPAVMSREPQERSVPVTLGFMSVFVSCCTKEQLNTRLRWRRRGSWPRSRRRSRRRRPGWCPRRRS